MFNFQLISELNGFSIAGAGILIVFVSISGLALIISCLHKCIDLYDKSTGFINSKLSRFKKLALEWFKVRFKVSTGLKEYAKKLKTISALTGEPFHISDLVSYAEKRGITSPSPVIIVEELLKANFIIKDESKKFRWNQKLCEILL